MGALDEEAASVVYRPFLQEPWTKMTLVVRTQADSKGIVNASASAVREIDRDLALYSVDTMEQVISDTPSMFLRRYPALLMAVFASFALILAAIGIYGVILTASVNAHRKSVSGWLWARRRRCLETDREARNDHHLDWRGDRSDRVVRPDPIACESVV